MAHRWRKQVCAAIKRRLRKRDGGGSRHRSRNSQTFTALLLKHTETNFAARRSVRGLPLMPEPVSFANRLPSDAALGGSAEINSPAMPRPAKLPDLSGVDITELKLIILAVLERHGMGPEWRRSMRGAQIGDMLNLCGGARQVLAEALAAVRHPTFSADPMD